MNVIFMGTPDFAVPSLKRLADIAHVQAVFCQPDRPRGRKRKPQPCPVKACALELGLPVHQPKRVKAKKWVNILRELAPDIIVVAAFGQILSQAILDIPKLACVNVHASLLPRWRGASPIHQAILHGDEETGVAIMGMVLALDAGPVYSAAKVPITPALGRPALEAKLAQLGADLLATTLPRLQDIEPTPQAEEAVTYAPMISKEAGFCDFATQNAQQIARMCRAYEGWPWVQCSFREEPLKLVAVSPLAETGDAAPGSLVKVSKQQLWVQCQQGSLLAIESVQPAGKRAMPVSAFNNGYRPQEGESLSTLQPTNET